MSLKKPEYFRQLSRKNPKFVQGKSQPDSIWHMVVFIVK